MEATTRRNQGGKKKRERKKETEREKEKGEKNRCLSQQSGE